MLPCLGQVLQIALGCVLQCFVHAIAQLVHVVHIVGQAGSWQVRAGEGERCGRGAYEARTQGAASTEGDQHHPLSQGLGLHSMRFQEVC